MRPSTGFQPWLEPRPGSAARNETRHCGTGAPTLAIVLHRMWVDETESRWTREAPLPLPASPKDLAVCHKVSSSAPAERRPSRGGMKRRR